MVILGRIVDGKKLCRQRPCKENAGAWGHMVNYRQLLDKKSLKEREMRWATRGKKIKASEKNRKGASKH